MNQEKNRIYHMGQKNKTSEKMRKQNQVSWQKRHFGAAVGLLFVCSFILGGCTLANPALQETETEQLIGILVAVGEQEAACRQEQELEGKTFSNMKELEESLTAFPAAEGTLKPDGTIEFEGVEGHMLGILEEETEEHPTTHFVNDGYFTKVKANTSVTDEGTENTISGAILAMEGLKEPVYMYPVYRRSDGSYYTVLENSGYLMSSVHCEGEVYGHTLQWDTTEEINGKAEKNSREIRVSLEMAEPVEQIQARMYSEENELLETRKISRGTEEVALQEGTAYVIVEEVKKDGSIKRSLYNCEEAQEGLEHCVYYPGSSGLIAPETVTFIKN